MQRIEIIDEDTVSPETAALLSEVRTAMGGVPKILATMAQSPAALESYLGFAGPLNHGVLPGALREQIALAVAGANRCDYCASVHTALGLNHGLTADEVNRNLRGESADVSARAALRFAVRIVESRGHVANADLSALRESGFTEEEIVEIIAVTMLNMFTNYFNHIANTDVDFPLVKTGEIAAA